MIVKSISRKDPNCFFDLPDYIVNETDRLYDKHGKSFLIKHNLRGDTVKGWEKQLKANETFRKVRRTDSVLVYHEILSWHKKDAGNLTMDKMKAMTEQYIQLKNPNGMYLAAPHYDKEHYHVHICTSGVEYKSGDAMRLSKKTYAELKVKIQEYQIEQYPELKSIENHGKGEQVKVTDREYQLKHKTGRESQKDKLVVILEQCYSFALSIPDFLSQLKARGILVYYRNEILTGVKYEGLKFRLKRLGYPKERIGLLEIRGKRQDEMTGIRERDIARSLGK